MVQPFQKLFVVNSHSPLRISPLLVLQLYCVRYEIF